MSAWPLLDSVARQHLDGGAVAGRGVLLDVPGDEATAAARHVLTSCGADVAGDATAELVVHPWQVGVGDRLVDVPLLDPTGEAHGRLRAVLRVTNRRLPGATVAVVGFQTLSRVDFHDHRNVVIVATAVGLAMYVTAQPDVAKAVPDWAQIILGSGITLGSITAIVLNFLFHHIGSGRGPAVAGAPGSPGFGSVMQGFIETSNVNVVTEITNLITAQRAYEMNSRVITTSDQMQSTLTNLR